MNDQINDHRFSSRKFLLTILVLATGVAFLLLGQIDAALWVDLTKWTLGLYFAGNVGTWAVEAFRAPR